MNDSKNINNSPKKEYTKPTLKSFPLVADEVMSTGCKVDATAVGNAGQCAVGVTCYDSQNLGS